MTRDYLLERHGVPKNKMVYVQGGIISRAAFVVPEHRPRFGIDKDALDIGFVANRYTPRGEDKGYDLRRDGARGLQCGRDSDLPRRWPVGRKRYPAWKFIAAIHLSWLQEH